MALVKGPFTIKWGDNTITDVTELEVEMAVDSEDYNTIGGTTIEIDGNYKATVMLTLLKSDISAQAAIVPQYFVANGDTLSTGETVNNADGAIDVKPQACGSSDVYNNLDIISCATNATVLRLVNARSRIDGYEIDEKVQKVMIKFIGEADSGEAVMQQFIEGTISVVS